MRKLLFFLLFIVFFSACKDETYDMDFGCKLQINSVNLNGLQTRQASGDYSFPSGSSIGLSVGGNSAYDKYSNIAVDYIQKGDDNHCWMVKKDVFLSATSGKLYSYYPYMDNAQIESIPIQSGDTDWMYGTPLEVSSKNNSVNLTMNHALSCLEFYIKKGKYGRAGIVSDISINSNCWAETADLDATTGNLTNIKEVGNEIKNGGFVLTDEGFVIRNLFVPSGVKDDIDIKIIVDDYTYVVTISDCVLSQGIKTQFFITFDEDEIVLSSAMFEDWSIVEKETANWTDIFNVGDVIEAEYNVTDISTPTQILSSSSSFYLSNIRSMEIDGNIVDKTKTYQFQNAGKHTVRYLLNNGAISVPSDMFSNCTALSGLKLSENIVNFYSYCFYKCEALVDFILPENFKSLGEYAFFGCPFLESLSIGKNTTSIGAYSVSNCPNLKTITVDDENEKYDSRDNCNAIIEKSTNTLISGCRNSIIPNTVEIIGKGAFYGCYGLEDITIPEGVTTIESYAFYGCPDLIKVNLPSTLTNINTYCFRDCKNLLTIKTEATTSPTLGNNVFYDGAYYGALIVPSDCVSAYSGWMSSNSGCLGYYKWTCVDSNYNIIDDVIYTSDMTTLVKCLSYKQGPVNIPSGVKTIQSRAFSNCSKVTDVKIPTSCTTIQQYAFYDCTGMNSVELPNNITTIDSYSFQNCTGLTEITIPNSVKNIYTAFSGCTGLITLKIGSGVSYISGNSFSGCSALENIIVDAGNTYYDSRNNCNAIIKTSSNILVTGCKNTVIPETVVEIGPYAFQNQKQINSVTIPNSVKILNNNCFSGCSNLKNITLSSSLEKINSCAFSDCVSLTGISLPNSIITIGSETFYGCKELQQINLPENLSTIGSYAFKNCSKLKEATIPASVTSIGSELFGYCTALEKVELSNSLTAIPSSCFYGCSSLKELTIPESIITISREAFSNSGIRKLILKPTTPPAVTSGSWGSFAGLEAAGILFVPENTADIYTTVWLQTAGSGYLADKHWLLIEGNDYLYENGVYYSSDGKIAQSMDASFSGHLSLRDGVTSIRDYAFYYCTGITGLTTPASLTTIGEYAFFGCSYINSVLLAENINEIKKSAFARCYRLNQITCLSTVAPQISSTTFEDLNSRGQLKVPYGCSNAYKTWMGTSAYYLGNRKWICIEEGNYIIDGNIIYSPDYKIVYGYNTKDLSGIVQIKNGAENIVPFAFRDCSNIVEIVIPNSVISIGDEAFSACSKVKKISIGENVNKIGNNTFSGTSSLKNFVSYARVAPTIQAYTFSGTSSSVSLSVPQGCSSSYSTWMQSSSYYPGYYSWKLTEH